MDLNVAGEDAAQALGVLGGAGRVALGVTQDALGLLSQRAIDRSQ